MTRVLIVEGEAWLGEHLEQLLQKEQFEAAVTSNAYSAIEYVDEYKPSVIVMSLMLSGASSVGLLHELQSYIDTAKVPVIAYSDGVASVQADELLPYGVHRLLDMTTMQPKDLAAAVRSVLA